MAMEIEEVDHGFHALAMPPLGGAHARQEKKLGGQIIWQATTMEIIADFLDRLHAERGEGRKSGTRAPFPAAGPGGSASPVPGPGASRPLIGGSVSPFPVPGGSKSPTAN